MKKKRDLGVPKQWNFFNRGPRTEIKRKNTLLGPKQKTREQTKAFHEDTV